MTRQEYIELVKQVWPNAQVHEVSKVVGNYFIGVHIKDIFLMSHLEALNIVSFAFNPSINYISFTTKSITE